MAFIYIPNGVHMAAWKPTEEGKAFELPETLKALAKHKDDLLVMTGLAQEKGFANGDGPGDHVPSGPATFLTGVQPIQDRRRQHPRRPLGRPGRGAGDRQEDAVRLDRAGDRPRRAVGQLRLGL